jgi:hypothetical protein
VTIICPTINGSIKLKFGTAAFVIEGSASNHRIIGANQVPGPIIEGDSHRCEVSGLYAIILLVKELCVFHKIHAGHIKICCDNMTALDIFDPDFLPDPKMKNFDLVVACWNLLKSTPVIWKPKHVKGHQDTAFNLATLSRQAKLNVAMDKMAKAYWICYAKSIWTRNL